MCSKLRSFEDTLLNTSDFTQLRDMFQDYVQSLNIPRKDKIKLIFNIRDCRNIEKLQFLYYNSILKFEGMGVI